MCRARLLQTTRQWLVLRMCHHLISQRRQSGLSLSTHSIRRIKLSVARNLFSLKHKIGLKAAPPISTTIRPIISLSKSSNQFGLSTKTENFKRNDEMKRPSKFWTSGLRRVQELKQKFWERKNTLTLQQTLKKRVVLCVQTGKAKTSTQTMTRPNRILPQTRVSSKRGSGLSEQTTLIPCQTNGTNRNLL